MTNSKKSFARIADPEILAIAVIECHESLVDIKQKTELLYGPPPECEATALDYTKMRKTVFEKLCLVQASLPHGWRLRLYEGFRSLAVQKMLFEAEYKKVCARFPKANAEQLFYEATRLVSPVINLDGSKNIPPHNTGAAVDVEIVDQHGQLIDMGMAAKDWLEVEPELCATYCENVSAKARQNRLLLLEKMAAQGFVNYPTEWWHYSYGDRYWAYGTKMPHAIYGAL